MPIIRNIKDGKITLKDGTGTPVTLELTFDGEFSFEGGIADSVRVRDRGGLGQVIDGDEQPYTWSLKAPAFYLLSDTGGAEDLSVREFMERAGEGAALVSVAPAGEKYAFNMNPDGTGKNETLAFGKCRCHARSFSESMDGNGFEVSGEAETMVPARA